MDFMLIYITLVWNQLILDMMDELLFHDLNLQRICTIKLTSKIKSKHPKWWIIIQTTLVYPHWVYIYGGIIFFIYVTVVWMKVIIDVMNEIWCLVSNKMRICMIKLTSEINYPSQIMNNETTRVSLLWKWMYLWSDKVF